MRVINSKTKLLYLLIIVMVAALASSASAIFDNAYKDGVTNYSESWGDGQLTGAIAWGVYDGHDDFESDFDSLSAPGEGNFVYVYQIFNFEQSVSPVSYFSILGVAESEVDGQSAEDDSLVGGFDTHQPYSMDVNDTDGAYWEWESDLGTYSYILQEDASWLLILTSDFGPVDRDYEIRGVDSLQGPGDDGSIPEPITIALLGAGGAFFIRKRRQK